MKKILTFLMVFVALFTFVACDTGNSSSGNGGNGTSNDVAKEFADCTTDVDFENVVFSNGNWNVIGIQQRTEGIASVKLQATAKDNSFTYTSGTGANIIDASIMFEEYPEHLDALRNAKNDEEKTAMSFGGMPEGATVTWDGLIATMTFPLSQEDLEADVYKFSSFPEDAVVKCNADKTKYVISITHEEGPVTYYIEKKLKNNY